MNSLFKTKLAKVSLASTATAGLLLIGSLAQAKVVIDDGQVHVINDATYASEHIEVRNGSTLIIVDGAVISASAFPDYDVFHNDSGLQVLEFSAAAIRVFDHSMVIVQGGTFGGEPFDVNPFPGEPGNPNNPPHNFENNWYSGSIAAFDHAKVIIEAGTFGAGAFRSGTVAMFDHAKLDISGGTFTNDGGSGGQIELFGRSAGNISGGFHGSSLNPTDNSHLNISGGFFGKGNFPDGGFTFFRGSVRASGSAAVNISGGDFGAEGLLSGFVGIAGSSTLKISGGTFNGSGADAPFGTPGWLAGRIDVSDDGDAKIWGGQFNGTTVNIIEAGQLKIQGCAFNLPFGKLWDTAASIEGVLANGDVIDVDMTRQDSPDAIVKLIKECNL